MKCQIYNNLNAEVEIVYNTKKFIMSKKAMLEFWEIWKPYVNAGFGTISIKKYEEKPCEKSLKSM